MRAVRALWPLWFIVGVIFGSWLGGFPTSLVYYLVLGILGY